MQGRIVGLVFDKMRSLAARANHLAHNRANIQFDCKELSPNMAHPDWEAIVRLGNLLKGTARIVHTPGVQSEVNILTVCSDANRAGDKET